MTLMGIQPLAIYGKSMTPYYKHGDVVLVMRRDSILNVGTYEIGDIVSFKIKDISILHRIVKYNETTVITKGDNNLFDDKRFYGEEGLAVGDIDSKVLFWVPYAGTLAVSSIYLKIALVLLYLGLQKLYFKKSMWKKWDIIEYILMAFLWFRWRSL